MSTGDILGGIGAGIGFFLGGPTGAYWGFMAGETAGNLIDPPTGPNVSGPRLSNLHVQSSAYGSPIPEVFGSMRLAGNVIWSTGLQEHKHVKTQGGKGGGGPTSTQTTYTYTSSFAVALCQGPVTGIRKIWADGKLIANRTSNASASALYVGGQSSSTQDVIAVKISTSSGTTHGRVYLGTETQTADPTIEAHVGTGKVPAHRGLCYIVFEDMPLKDYGNRLPNITVEVATSDTTKIPTQVGSWAPFHGSYYNVPDGSNNYRPVLIDASDGVITEGYTPVYVNSYGWGRYRVRLSYDTDGHFLRRVVEKCPSTWYTTSLVRRRPAAGLHMASWPGVSGVVVIDEASNQPLPDPRVGYVGAYNQLAVPRPVGAVYAYGHLFTPVDYASSSQFQNGIHDAHLNIYSDSDLVQQIPLPNDDYIGYIKFDVDPDTARIVIGERGVGIHVWDYDASGQWVFSYKAAVSNYPNEEIGSISGTLVATSGTVYQLDDTTQTVAKTYSMPGIGADDANDDPDVLFFAGSELLAMRVGCNYYGNLLVNGNPSLSSVVTSICEDAGLALTDIDVSQLTGLSVEGYTRTQPMTGRAALQPLLQANFIDIAESDDQIKFIPRGQASVATISEDDLATREASQSMPDIVTRDRTDDRELPVTVQVQYNSPANDYQVGQQYARRLITDAVAMQTVQLPMAMSDDTARQIADVLLYDAWQARTLYTVYLPPSYMDLDTSDVITVVTAEATYTLRITSVDMTLPGIVKVQGVAEEAAVYTPSSAAGAGSSSPAQTISIGGPTDLQLIDSTLVRDTDNDPGFYYAAAGYLSGWHGSVVYRSTDGGVTYADVGTVTSAAQIGTAQTVLADGPVTRWDDGNTVQVQMLGNTALAGTNDLAVLNGSNSALFGAPGRWELIAFGDAVLNSDGSYTLSRLLRGLRGTEWATGLHQVGDTLVLLSTATVQRMHTDAAEIGLSRDYKGVTFGSSIDSVDADAFTNAATGLMPYAPVHIAGSRNSSGDLAIRWVRRTRIGGEWADYVDVPLGETSESYELDVLDGSGNVLRTLSSTTPSVIYTAADQTSDFGSAQASVAVRIYQLSASVGRGYAGSATL